MDPLAHTLVGAALAETRLGRTTRWAMPTLMLAANVADVDVASYAVGSDFALGFRRGWTHGPLGLAVLPGLLVGVLLLLHRWWPGIRSGEHRPPPGPLLALAYLAALTHPALDWLNTYGVRLLAPCDWQWFYGDTLFIVDPWMWLILGGGVFLAHRATRRSLPMWGLLAAATTVLLFTATEPLPGKLIWLLGIVGAGTAKAVAGPSRPESRSRVAAVSVILFCVYGLAMLGGAWAARSRVAAELALAGDERTRETLMVGPVPVNPFTREVVVATRTEYRYGRFHWLPRPRLEMGLWSHARLTETAIVEAALADPCIRGFLSWARFPFGRVQEHEDHATVDLMDARYTRQPDARFGSVTVRVPRNR